MMPTAAGSNHGRPQRVSIQGNIVLARTEQVRALRRLSTITLGQLFSHAKEQGSAMVTLEDQPWTILRHPDHTFTLVAGTPGHPSL